MKISGLEYIGFFIFFICVSFDSNDSQKIEWSGQRLTWDVFKGPINPRSSGIASTFSYISMEIVSENKDSAVINVAAVFSVTKSWVAYKEKTVLKHENGHFDITELFTRKLRKKIKETVFVSEKLKSQLRQLYSELDNKMDKYHDKYDDETESSMNSAQQKTWEEKIAIKLEEHKAFASKRMVIKF